MKADSCKANKMKNIYLACPYSHPDREVRQKRAGFATYVAAHLMKNKFIVFSPITHGHALGNFMSDGTHTWSFWKPHCQSFLNRWADALYVLALPEWEASIGVEAEISLARFLSLPIHFLEVETSGEIIITDNQPVARRLVETKS